MCYILQANERCILLAELRQIVVQQLTVFFKIISSWNLHQSSIMEATALLFLLHWDSHFMSAILIVQESV
jgi:hypothetical protein